MHKTAPMAESSVVKPPIFVLADNDVEALRRLTGIMSPDWYLVPVWDVARIARSARRFSARAIFLADGIAYEGGGVPALLQLLLDEAEAPVIVMAEVWEPAVAEKWKRMGALDCIPHPTRVDARIEIFRSKLQKLALSPAMGA